MPQMRFNHMELTFARGELDEARLNRLFDEMKFGGMLRRRCMLTG